VGQELLIFEASKSHSGTPNSVGLLWMSGQSAQKPLPDNTKHSKETAINDPAGFKPADLRHRPRGHRDMPE